jgi:hypothetical protein
MFKFFKPFNILRDILRLYVKFNVDYQEKKLIEKNDGKTLKVDLKVECSISERGSRVRSSMEDLFFLIFSCRSIHSKFNIEYRIE